MDIGNNSRCSPRKSEFHIDVNVTSKCNLACTYCSEGESCGLSSTFEQPTTLTPDDLMRKIRELDQSKYQAINIYFWGGEAFTNWPFCKSVMEKAVDDRIVNFMFYTNGTYLKKYKKVLAQTSEKLGNRLNNGMPRLHIQVSFDGEPINTMERHTKKGESKEMSDHVYNSYLDLRKDGFSIGLKQTISARNFKYLFDTWKWHYDRGEFYGPTPDTHGDDTKTEDPVSQEEYRKHLKDLSMGMLKISKYCLDNNIDPKKTFRWFAQDRANCSAGMNYLSVDLDGKLYPCHGCMYRQRDDHKVGTIEENLQEVTDASLTKFRGHLTDFMTNGILNCNNCDVGFCMKCPAGSFDSADKKDESYGEKWQDHTANYQLCQVWKTISPVVKATNSFMQKQSKSSLPRPGFVAGWTPPKLPTKNEGGWTPPKSNPKNYRVSI